MVQAGKSIHTADKKTRRSLVVKPSRTDDAVSFNWNDVNCICWHNNNCLNKKLYITLCECKRGRQHVIFPLFAFLRDILTYPLDSLC